MRPPAGTVNPPWVSRTATRRDGRDEARSPVGDPGHRATAAPYASVTPSWSTTGVKTFAVNRAYLRGEHREREDLAGRFIVDAGADSGPDLAATVHASALSACHAALEKLTREHVRVTDAFTALAGWHGVDGSLDAQHRRRRLWRAVLDRHEGSDPCSWLESVWRQAERIRPATDGVAVSTFVGSEPANVLAASNPWAQEIETLQQVVGEGPGMDVAASHQAVLAEDLKADRRWPVFALLAIQAGARSAWSVPLTSGRDVLGTMTFFGRTTDPWKTAHLIDSFLLADLAASAMVADAANIEEGATNEAAVGSRDQVAMAVGMVSVQLGVPVDEAWVRLRAYAFRSGMPLEAAARAVLEGRLQLD